MNNIFTGKNIHIVGITGNEGSAILDYISPKNPHSITGHDFVERIDIEKSFKTWHKGISETEKEKLWQNFRQEIPKISLKTKDQYLEGIEKADIIFVSQSWRLYKENQPLYTLKEKGDKQFYSLTRLYLSHTKAKTIVVTGTVGKGSTANLIYHVLLQNIPKDRTVVFAGNETWRQQVGRALDDLKETDFLVLEVSHRQLLDGIKEGPDIAVFTNLYPNHLDELTFENYKKIKLSLLNAQSSDDIAILNYDSRELKDAAQNLKSNVIFFSLLEKNKNSNEIASHFDEIIRANPNQYPSNLLAAGTTCSALGIDISKVLDALKTVPVFKARLELIKELDGIKIYDDIKSTTPWAALAALEKLGKNTILICGGETKGLNYTEFLSVLPAKAKRTIILKSELKKEGEANLEKAVSKAFALAKRGDNILISPAAAFFYTKFIKGRKSLRKIITSLPPREKVSKGKD